MSQTIPHGSGRYLKKCQGCKKEFRSDSRNARFGPPELCKCLSRRAKNRQKRAKERRAYHKDPEIYKALSKTRSQARKTVLAHFGVTVKSSGIVINDKTALIQLGCNSPGCTCNFLTEVANEQKRRVETGIGHRGTSIAALKNLLRKLEAHHRNHNPFDNTFENYPHGSNVELLCRRHHEHADRAKAGKAQIVLWTEPQESWYEYLVRLYATDRRRFWLIPVSAHLSEWKKLST